MRDIVELVLVPDLGGSTDRAGYDVVDNAQSVSLSLTS